MKKTIICAFSALVLAPVCATAQVFSDENFAQPPATEANHSVSLHLFGLSYAYELPVSRMGTVIGRAGADFGMARGSNFFETYSYWGIVPYIEIEPRWYYGLDRRESKGRNTYGNAGSFVSLRVQNAFPGYVSDPDMRIIGNTCFVPTWGLRRVWGEGWMFEFSTGYMIGFSHRDRWWGDDRLLHGINLNVRFGYSF